MRNTAPGPHVSAPNGDATAPSERIALLDILRGLALFGMILVHFHQKMRFEVGGLEDLIGWGVWIFVEEKAWGTFAFLFGVGFAVLLRRIDARGERVVPLYLRRLGALAAFGVVAEVGFGFTILLNYAFWGVALLFIRRWSSRTLLITAGVAACAMFVTLEVSGVHMWLTASPPPTPSANAILHSRAAEGTSYLALLAARWTVFVAHLPRTWRDFIPDTNLALFILGLLAVRHGVLEDPRRHVRLIAKWMTFGAVSWAAAWFADLVVEPRLSMPVPAMKIPFLRAFGLVNDQWLCLTYIGALALLLAYRPQWIRRLAVFGLAGRMALTNYMLQIAVLDVLASKYGLGLKLRPSVYVCAAVALFSLEAAFSRAWLTRCRFGPLEWLWRTVTYMRAQPLSREPTAQLEVASA